MACVEKAVKFGLARHVAGKAVPDRAQHDHGGTRVPEVRRLSDCRSGADFGGSVDQLDRRTQIPARSRLAAGGLESSRDPADFLPSFADWRFGWLDVAGLIQAADACFEYPMVDRDPLDRWTFGRVTLMGDAAHPMYPIGSNGASQGILDARVLARELRQAGPTPEAVLAYEAERRPATAKIVMANRANGPEQVMQLVEQRAPQGFDRIEDVLTADELDGTAAGYKRVAGFDRDSLNARGPIV
jgi:2-polyprenyl-6-methoxyphenol hydroxylase-like FAD-dependent oxidoreductase